MLSSDTNSGRNIAIKNNVSALKKLSNLTHKERKFHLNNWGVDAFKDIKKYLKLAIVLVACILTTFPTQFAENYYQV